MTEMKPILDFDQKSSNRWVWIVPSIILHIVVFAVWYFMPDDEPRKPQERRMIVKPEQVEHLQKHVEDANLKELRAEVLRLQEIKRAMAQIRSENFVELASFELEMKQADPGDALVELTELLESKKALLGRQKAVFAGNHDFAKILSKFKPSIQDKDLSELAPLAEEVLEHALSHNKQCGGLGRSFLQFRAELDSAGSVVGWLDAPELVEQWEVYSQQAEDVSAVFGGFADEQKILLASQVEALDTIVKANARITRNSEKMKQSDANLTKIYERKKKADSDKLPKQSKELEKQTKILSKVDSEIKELESQRDIIVKSLSELDSEKADEKKQHAQLTKKLEKAEASMTSKIGARERSVEALDKSKAAVEATKERLSQLKPPELSVAKTTPEEELEMQERLEKSLKVLSGPASNLSAQENIIELQKRTIQQCEELILNVQNHQKNSQ